MISVVYKRWKRYTLVCKHYRGDNRRESDREPGGAVKWADQPGGMNFPRFRWIQVQRGTRRQI